MYICIDVYFYTNKPTFNLQRENTILIREGKKKLIKYKENKNHHKLCHQNLCYFKIVFLVKIVKLKVETHVQNTGIHITRLCLI